MVKGHDIVKDHIKIFLITFINQEISIFKKRALQNLIALQFQVSMKSEEMKSKEEQMCHGATLAHGLHNCSM